MRRVRKVDTLPRCIADRRRLGAGHIAANESPSRIERDRPTGQSAGGSSWLERGRRAGSNDTPYEIAPLHCLRERRVTDSTSTPYVPGAIFWPSSRRIDS